MSPVTLDQFLAGEPVDYIGASGEFRAQYRRYPLGNIRITTPQGRIVDSWFQDEPAARSFFANLKRPTP